MDCKVVLASTSPRRQSLLSLLFQEFDIMSADIDEKIYNSDRPEVAVMSLAFQKAMAVAERCSAGTLVIAADTIVYRDGFMGKPGDAAAASLMLKQLSAGSHRVLTGMALIDCATHSKSVLYREATVQFAELSEREIAWYIKTHEPLDKAGGYGIQGYAARFITSITGDYYAVMGLSLAGLYQEITRCFPAYRAQMMALQRGL